MPGIFAAHSNLLTGVDINRCGEMTGAFPFTLCPGFYGTLFYHDIPAGINRRRSNGVVDTAAGCLG